MNLVIISQSRRGPSCFNSLAGTLGGYNTAFLKWWVATHFWVGKNGASVLHLCGDDQDNEKAAPGIGGSRSGDATEATQPAMDAVGGRRFPC